MSLIVAHPSTTMEQHGGPLLDVVQRIIPQATIDRVVAQYTRATQRRRKLPGEVLVLLFMTLHLVPPAALDLVLAILLAGPRTTEPQRDAPATESAISHARYRWGARPLITLFQQVCQPLATPTTQGAWLDQFRLMALDSSIDDVADTPANERFFGRHHGAHGPAAYPQFVGMYLSECGTRAVIDAGIWPCHADVHRAAKRLLRSVTPGMLLLWDQGLHSFSLASGTRQRQAHFLSRVPPSQTFEPIRVLPDGSLLAALWGAAPTRRTAATPRLLVRVLTYTITDPARPGSGERHRLMTSLLDPARFPALRLICAYHERGEIELALDEMGTHQRLAAEPFRAKKPVGVLQEVYGLLLAHYAVRAVIHDAAGQVGIDPDRISFVHAVRLIAAVIPVFQLQPPDCHAALSARLLQDIACYRLPARSARQVPRECKRPRSKHRLRRRDRPYRTVRVAPFADVVSLLQPTEVAPCHTLSA